MNHLQSFENFEKGSLNESAVVDMGGAEPVEIKILDGGISLVQASKMEKGKKNVIVIPEEFILKLTAKMEVESLKLKK